MTGPAEPIARGFGALLRSLREERGISLRQAAPRLQTSAPQLSRLERDVIPPDPAVAHAAEALFERELKDRNAIGHLVALADAAVSLGREGRDTSRGLRLLGREPPPLFGREEEQAQLRAAVEEGGVVVVHGPPGVGKTALVSTVVRQLVRAGRDELLVAGARANTDPELAYRVFGQWLTDVGAAEDQLPVSTEQRANALLRATASRRLVLVVEDVDELDPIQPLLRLASSSGSPLVITSHGRLTELALRGGARLIQVRPLTSAVGTDVLRSLLPEARLESACPSDLEAVARLCGGLPLALEVIADVVNRHDRLEVDELQELLGDPTTRLELLTDVNDPARDLRALLTETYSLLPLEVRWLFRLLGLHGGPVVTLAAAAALAGQSTETVHRGLLALADVHLLEQTGPGLWAWPDLPRLVAGELLRRIENPFQIMHAARRVARWLLRLGASAATEPAESERGRRAVEELDAEAPNLAAFTAMLVRQEQQSQVQRLVSWLEQAGRGDLARRCVLTANRSVSARSRWTPASSDSRSSGRSP